MDFIISIMEELDKNLYVNRLIDLYGELLTDHQRNILELYYRYDLSLSEIAEQEEVSRNAVHDSLKKSIALLNNYEDKLKLLQKEDKLDKFFKEIKQNRSQEELDLIDKDRYVPIVQELYSKSGRLLKTIYYDGYSERPYFPTNVKTENAVKKSNRQANKQ